MTSFNPLPAHLQAVQEERVPNGGMETPSYGGTVMTGHEWDYVTGRDAKRSPSRSPQRSAADSRVPTANQAYSPSPLSGASAQFGATPSYSAYGPSPPSAYSAGHPQTPPAAYQAYPQSPTINSDAAAHVGKMVSISRSSREEGERERRHASGSGSRNGASGSGVFNGNGHGTVKEGQSRSRNRTVGDWQLQKTLGAGSMGKVKLAVNIHTKEKCAVKIIPRYSDATRREEPRTAEEAEKQRLKDDSKEVRTIREAAISLLLHHPYICGMREFITHTNHHYMVTEFIDGGQMLDYIISHGRLRERAARKFARQIGSALEYCHRNSIVHRDLKIENILISKNGNIKIIDFGLSNLFAPSRHLSTFCGSLYFAAPELLNAKVYTGPEVDVWSFGIVLYVLVCGKVPFDDQSMPALHAKIKRGIVEYPAWLSNECKSLLARMLVTTPSERATLSEVLQHPFMIKGYDGPPESHLIRREPLRADELDWDVINAMGGFTFGSQEQIYEELHGILSSDLYLQTVSSWETRRDKKRGTTAVGIGGSSSSMALSDISDSPKKKRFSGFDLKKKLFREEKKVEEPVVREKEGQDPTRAFDPLISIYFLAREKIERERLYGKGHFASSQTSIEPPNGATGGGFGMSIPSLTVPPTTHTMGYETPASSGDRSPPGSGPRERARDIPNPVMQHPGADEENSQIADVPLAHRRQPSVSNPPTPLQPSLMQMEDAAAGKKFGLIGKGTREPLRPADGDAPRNSMGVTASPSMPLEGKRGATMSDKKHERRVSVGSISNSMGRLGRRTSQSKAPNGGKKSPEEGGWMPNHKEADEARVATPDQALPQSRSTAISPPSPAIGTNGKYDDGSDEAEVEPVKSVYLKGLFSVATTSTKSATVLNRDIAAVLNRIGIKHRPIRGGFECVHVPSIVLGSVQADEATLDLPSTTGAGLASSKGTMRRPSIRRKKSKQQVGEDGRSRGSSPAPPTPSQTPAPAGESRLRSGGSSGTVSASDQSGTPNNLNGQLANLGIGTARVGTPGPGQTGAEDDVDAWALAAGGGVGGKMIVRFEISVVKVPWLPLHGIQFRRISGDGWAYQQLAKTVLKEMRL